MALKLEITFKLPFREDDGNYTNFRDLSFQYDIDDESSILDLFGVHVYVN